MQFWAIFHLIFILRHEKQILWVHVNSETIVGICYNKDKYWINAIYISCFKIFHFIKSECNSHYAALKDYPKLVILKSMLRKFYFTIGMREKLTFNTMPEVMLFNNTCSIITCVVYLGREGCYQNKNLLFITEFLDYSDPLMSPVMQSNGCGK